MPRNQSNLLFPNHPLLVFLICLIGVLIIVKIPSISRAQETSDATENDLTALEKLLEEDVVITASKTLETATQAPATVTVITAQQIREMGAVKLIDVLRTVPGVETFIDEYGYTQVGIRGGRMEGERVKFLINGHPVNPPRTGQPSIFFDDLIVENMKRLEVIRGPGSALYGTNALNGVINIITKNADDVNGFELIAKGGSDETWHTGMLFGKTFGDIKLSGYAEYFDTRGPELTIEEDQQTLFDRQFAPYGIPPVSLAPGKTDAYRTKTDLNVSLNYKNFALQSKYLKKMQGPFIGANFTLNDDSEWDLEYFFLEGQYTHSFRKSFDLLMKLSWDRVTEDYYIQGSPPGFTIPMDLDGDGDIEIFPEGRKGRQLTKFDIFGSEVQGTYRLGETHTIISGIDLQEIRQFDTITESNFDRRTLAALDPGVVDTTPSYDDNRRTIFAMFLQDQWTITDALGLTLGVRYDHYSDFGGTTNPRAGLVWNIIPDVYLKVLYGQAFLAPSFHEAYLKNNPLIVGEKNLDPAKIQTFEVGVIYNLAEYVTGSITYFYNREDDVIIPTIQTDPNQPSSFTNGKGDIIQGLELELKANVKDRLQGYASYTFRNTEDRSTHEEVPFISKHLAKLGVDLAITRYLNTAIQASFVGEKHRETGDQREPLAGYCLVNTTLTAKHFYQGLEAFVSLYNLFDTEYFDPSLNDSLPNDYPKPGRTVLAGIRYHFAADE